MPLPDDQLGELGVERLADEAAGLVQNLLKVAASQGEITEFSKDALASDQCFAAYHSLFSLENKPCAGLFYVEPKCRGKPAGKDFFGSFR